jgi:hypothetical protein
MNALKVGFCLLVLISLVAVIRKASAQDDEPKREVITVKSAENSGGVIVLTARGEKTTVELQCTKTVPSCANLKPGEYLMLRLPKNRGVYDCMNVRVYDKAADPDDAEQLGAYCVTDK